MLSRLCVVSRWDSAAGRQITFSFLFLFPLGKYTKYINVYEKRSLHCCCNAAPVCICIAEAISLSRSSRRMNAHCAQFWAAADSVRYYRSDPFCPSLFQFTPPHPPPVSLLDVSRCVCVLCVLLAAASQAHPILISAIFLSFSPPSPIVHQTFILFF